MPIKIEISGEQSEVETILARLAKSLDNRNDATTMPIDDLMTITRVRFNAAGFGVAVTQQNPALEQEDKPTPAEAEAIVENIEKALVEPKRRGRPPTTTLKKPPAPDPQLEADKTYVVEEMTKRFGDPKQKLKAKAFIDVVTGRNGGVRLSLLPAELFPEIKAEMETEFAIPRKNNGAEAHA